MLGRDERGAVHSREGLATRSTCIQAGGCKRCPGLAYMEGNMQVVVVILQNFCSNILISADKRIG